MNWWEEVRDKAIPHINSGIATLSQNDYVSMIPSDKFPIFYVEEFLDEDICDRLISVIRESSSPSTVVGRGVSDYRTSQTRYFGLDDPLVRDVDRKLNSLMGISPEFGESIQGLKYGVGEEFKRHEDFFATEGEFWDKTFEFGQRTWSVIIYLNSCMGGETNFPKAGIEIIPNPGLVIMWPNLTRAGVVNYATTHLAKSVTEGEKFILTKWYRESPRPFVS
jgi:prolyl 4-hydroxylase